MQKQQVRNEDELWQELEEQARANAESARRRGDQEREEKHEEIQRALWERRN